MGNAEFIILIFTNLWTFAGSAAIAIALFYLIYRRVIVSILDPISMALFGSCAGFAVVIFLMLTDSIQTIYFWGYLATQIAFILGFFLSIKSKTKLTLKKIGRAHV